MPLGFRQRAGANANMEPRKTGEGGSPQKLVTSVLHTWNLKYLPTQVWCLAENSSQWD